MISVFSANSFAASIELNPYLVVNAQTGDIIAANKENDRWYPASLTKLMSIYVTLKAIEGRELEMGSPVRISKRAHKMPPSRMGYAIGTKIRVDTALKITIVKSANDVAIALAEAVAGNVEQFVMRMNKTATALGMLNTHYTNPNGLHSPNQYTTARDLAILSRHLLLDFPQYSRWFAVPSIATPKKIHYSYNLLLERFPGANGMKTGFVCASGYNMVASAKRNGVHLLAIVLGEKSQTDRAILAARLLQEGFVNFDKFIDNIATQPSLPGANPVNMRSLLCTTEARKNRYEPGAGAAVVKSIYLQKRHITQQPMAIRIGGVDGPPSQAYKMRQLTPKNTVAIPTPRPQYSSPLPIDQKWQTINSRLRGTIPLPIWRPNQ